MRQEPIPLKVQKLGGLESEEYGHLCILSRGTDQVGEERFDSGLGSKLYGIQSQAGWLRPLGFLCRPFPGAMALLRILTLPHLLVRYSPVPDFRNSPYTTPVSTSVLSHAS